MGNQEHFIIQIKYMINYKTTPNKTYVQLRHAGRYCTLLR